MTRNRVEVPEEKQNSAVIISEIIVDRFHKHLDSLLNPLLANSHFENRTVLVEEGDRGSTVVKVLRHKSGGHWFDPIWCHWNSSLT
jgi:hypothetical protein